MLIKHTILYLPAQLLGPLFQFIAAVVWTHFLAADAYGVLTYIMASQEMVYVICLAWWSQYTLRYAGSFLDDRARALFQSSENAILCVSAIAQAIIGVALLLALHVPLTPSIVCTTAVYCVSRSVTTHLCERARAAGRIANYTIAQTFGPAAGFGIALILVMHVDASPEAALFGFTLAQVIGLAWLWREMGLGTKVALPDATILRRAVAFGTPLILSGAIAWISLNGIRLIVDHMRGTEAVGLISVGWGLGQRLASVVAMLVTAAAFPLAVKHLQAGSRDAALRQLSMGGAILFGLLAPSAIGILLLTRPMVDLMISEPFRAVTIATLPAAALAGAVRNLRIHFSDQVPILFERTNLTISINVVEACSTIVLCFLGLMWGGLPGAAIGCLAGACIATLYGFGLGIVKFGLIVPWADMARISLATGIMALLLVAVPFERMAPNLTLRLVVEIAAGGVIYLCALLALYPEVVREIRRRARGRESVTP